MQKGVQIFILAENIKYSREMCEEWGRKPHALISAGLKDRSVQWLNRDKGINPIPPPTP
jgi:hypothetical protein